MTLPVVLTCGDPSGVGPEIAVAARQALGDDVPFVWIGDPRHLPVGTRWVEVETPDAALEVDAASLPVLRHDFPAEALPGAPDPANAKGVVDVIARAVGLVQDRLAGAICTSPISKAELKRHAGFVHPGHTEYLAHLGGVEDVVMMLAAEELRVVPVTIHIPLSEVPKALTRQRLEATIRITAEALKRDFGIASPRIAVSGLNPHAGEAGTMGREELDLVAPVLDELRREGLHLTGPLPGDTMFHATARAGYDAAICMYHDQALIPIKTLAFDRGVNVTLGLPFVRTSPDHGTAFDIAGKGVANPTSTIEALKLAKRMAEGRGA